MASSNTFILMAAFVVVILANPDSLQRLYGTPVDGPGTDSHDHAGHHRGHEHAHHHHPEHEHSHDHLGAFAIDEPSLDSPELVSRSADETSSLLGTKTAGDSNDEIHPDNFSKFQSNLNELLTTAGNIGSNFEGVGSIPEVNVNGATSHIADPRPRSGNSGSGLRDTSISDHVGSSFEGPFSGKNELILEDLRPRDDEISGSDLSKIIQGFSESDIDSSRFEVSSQHLSLPEPRKISGGAVIGDFPGGGSVAAVTREVTGPSSGLVSNDFFIGDNLGVTVAELSGGIELTPAEIAAGLNYDPFKDVTVTYVSTIDVFRTVTNIFFNSVPVTLTEFIKTTATYQTHQVVATPVDDHVFVATAPVTRTDTVTVTDTRTAHQYVTEVSTVLYTVTHRAYDIRQLTVWSTIVQTQRFRPTVVSTVILTEMDTQIIQYTVTDTVVVDQQLFTSSPNLHGLKHDKSKVQQDHHHHHGRYNHDHPDLQKSDAGNRNGYY